MYKHTLKHWLNLYNAKPEAVIADQHRGYFSHQLAAELSKKSGAKLFHVQHHQAHFAAVLAENNLIDSHEPILGVIWDGTGLGTDGNIWGGEFFTYSDKEMLRCYYFDYYPAIAGDKMATEPRIAALCATANTWPQSNILKNKFSLTEWNNYQSLLNSTELFSSSAGRLFDAVASLLDLCDKQTYEGEAAQYVQVLAENYVSEHGFNMDASYFSSGAHYYRIPTASLLQNIIIDIEKAKDKNYIAAKFHYSLVCLVDIVARNLSVTKIAFSGGVFQNQLLVDWIINEHNDTYQLYFHQHLSPNDENISFGQMVYYDNEINAGKYEMRNMNDEIRIVNMNDEKVVNA
jgi:hydrogenase maturation protein HypF